jgi:hypothetical protein
LPRTPLLFLSLRGALSFAPRARSGRSGRASSPAVRPAFACDRAGTARRADPRCCPPSTETFGRGQRLHPPVWPLGARTLRRNRSCGPRGGWAATPPFAMNLHKCVRQARKRDLQAQPRGLRVGGNQSAGAMGGRSLRSPRVPDARVGSGRRRRGLMRTPRGPDADRAVRSRAEESAGAVRGGAPACRRPPWHREERTAVTQ